MFDLKSVALSGSTLSFGIAATFLAAAIKAFLMLIDQQAFLTFPKDTLQGVAWIFLAGCLVAALICQAFVWVARIDD